MGNFLTILKVVISLLPILTQLIQAVEAALPTGGQGAAKLAMVRSMLETAYNTIGGFSATFDQVWAVLLPAINSLVAVYKTNGTFASSTPHPVPVQ